MYLALATGLSRKTAYPFILFFLIHSSVRAMLNICLLLCALAASYWENPVMACDRLGSLGFRSVTLDTPRPFELSHIARS